MLNVRIDYSGKLRDFMFETKMPVIPLIGNTIGFWHGRLWVIATITIIVYEFDERGKYDLVSLTVSDEC
jgi:hypothetical protein